MVSGPLARLVVDQDQLRRGGPDAGCSLPAATDALLVGVALPDRAVDPCEPRDRLPATGYRLWRRYQEGGWSALADRPSTPKRQPRRLPRELEQRILAAREYATAGPLIVAGQLGLPASTVWKVLRRYGVSRMRRPPASRSAVTSGPGQASCSTSTSRDSAASGRSANACSAARQAPAAAAPAGSTCTSRSTTTPASPTPSCSPASIRPTASPSCAARSAGTASAGSRSSGCSPTTATASAQSPGATPVPSSTSTADTRAHGARKPTARPKRSSRHSCASGPTASPTPPAATAPERSPATSAGTTTTDHTARSAADRRSAASHRFMGPTPSGGE